MNALDELERRLMATTTGVHAFPDVQATGYEEFIIPPTFNFRQEVRTHLQISF